MPDLGCTSVCSPLLRKITRQASWEGEPRGSRDSTLGHSFCRHPYGGGTRDQLWAGPCHSEPSLKENEEKGREGGATAALFPKPSLGPSTPEVLPPSAPGPATCSPFPRCVSVIHLFFLGEDAGPWDWPRGHYSCPEPYLLGLSFPIYVLCILAISCLKTARVSSTGHYASVSTKPPPSLKCCGADVVSVLSRQKRWLLTG